MVGESDHGIVQGDVSRTAEYVSMEGVPATDRGFLLNRKKRVKNGDVPLSLNLTRRSILSGLTLL